MASWHTLGNAGAHLSHPARTASAAARYRHHRSTRLSPQHQLPLPKVCQHVVEARHALSLPLRSAPHNARRLLHTGESAGEPWGKARTSHTPCWRRLKPARLRLSGLCAPADGSLAPCWAACRSWGAHLLLQQLSPHRKGALGHVLLPHPQPRQVRRPHRRLLLGQELEGGRGRAGGTRHRVMGQGGVCGKKGRVSRSSSHQHAGGAVPRLGCASQPAAHACCAQGMDLRPLLPDAHTLHHAR